MAYEKYSTIVPFGLRLQSELKEKLEKEKKARGKPRWSLNAEIVQRLEDSLTQRNELTQFTDGELIDELIRRWGREAVQIHLGRPEDS